MDLRLLGEVRIQIDDRIVPLHRIGERCALATLAFNPGRPVRVDTLIENVWGDQQPGHAGQTIKTYVRAVRRAMTVAGGDHGWLVNRRPHAYELRVAPELIDYHRFTALATAGRTQADQGDHRAAIASYRQSLELWSGEPLAGLTGDWADWRRHALRQEHLDVLCRMFDEQLLIGDHSAVANRASQLIGEIIPTDRVLAAALHGLAGSGHSSHIPDFLERVEKRLQETSSPRVGADIRKLAYQLITNPAFDPGFTVEKRQNEGGDPRQEPEQDQDQGAQAPIRSRTAGPSEDATSGGELSGGRVTMNAMFNGWVAQAGGDQYITED